MQLRFWISLGLMLLLATPVWAGPEALSSGGQAQVVEVIDGDTVILDDGRQVRMVGANRGRQVDVRVLASTNKSLPALVAKGLFRQDLFFRLNVIPIELPPLRQRGDDILLLIRHFAEKYSRESGRPAPRFSTPRAMISGNTGSSSTGSGAPPTRGSSRERIS